MTSRLVQRLRERKLVQWALAYLAGAWVTLQVLSVVGQHFAWPSALLRSLTVLLAVGFFAALVIAWYHGEKGAQRVSGPELGMLIALLLIAGALVAMVAPDRDGSRTDDAVALGAGAAAAAAEGGSIAVLPFADLSEGRDQEYFSDGIAEELLNALARIDGLRVAARTSSFAARRMEADVTEIGQRLRVRHVIEGSVRRSGQRMRVNVQLVDVADGYHLWSETYDREVDDIFSVQEEIARAVVGALRLRLGADTTAPLVRRPTEDPEAYELYLKGRYFWNHADRPGNWERSVQFFREAVARDPTFALAWVGLADAHTDPGWTPMHEHWRRARAYAERALALDPGLAGAHNALAYVRFKYDWDWAAAEAGFREAMALDENDVVILASYGSLLTALGRLDEALALHLRARELDPVTGWVTCPGVAWPLHAMGEYERAIAECRSALELDPQSPWAHATLAGAYMTAGRIDEAVAASERAAELGGPEWRSSLAWAQAIAGRRAEAVAMLEELEREARTRYVPAADFAIVHLGLGDHGAALDSLERAYEERDHVLVWLKVSPVWDPVRSDPRFVRLIERVGLP